jgi:hypothetical protein
MAAQSKPVIPGFLYVVRLREHILTADEVYKVGRTADIFARMKTYPNGSAFLASIQVSDTVKGEAIMLDALRARRHVMARPELGTEYFAGPLEDIVACMVGVLNILPPPRIDNMVLMVPRTPMGRQCGQNNQPPGGDSGVNLIYEYQFIRDFVLRHQGTDVLERQADSLYEAFRVWLVQQGPTHRKHSTSAIKFGQKLSKLISAQVATGFTAIRKRRAPAGNVYTIDVAVFRQEMLAKHWCSPDD